MRSKRWWLAVVAVWGWMVMLPDPALGSSGFSLFEAGARSSALAGVVVARADDLSTIFYNPAGLVQLPGTQVMGGFSTFFPRQLISPPMALLRNPHRVRNRPNFCAPFLCLPTSLPSGSGWGWN